MIIVTNKKCKRNRRDEEPLRLSLLIGVRMSLLSPWFRFWFMVLVMDH